MYFFITAARSPSNFFPGQIEGGVRVTGWATKVSIHFMHFMSCGWQSTDLLSNRDAYLQTKKEMEVPDGEEEIEGEGEQPHGWFSWLTL